MGAGLLTLAAFSMHKPAGWVESVGAVLGLWLIASPWILENTLQRRAKQYPVFRPACCVHAAGTLVFRLLTSSSDTLFSYGRLALKLSKSAAAR